MVILAAAVTLLSEREASETVENKIYQKLKKEKWNVTLILDLFFTIKYDNLHLLLFKKKQNIDL